MPSGEKSDKTKIESLVVDTAECSNRTNDHKHKSKLVLESIKQANIKLWKTTTPLKICERYQFCQGECSNIQPELFQELVSGYQTIWLRSNTAKGLLWPLAGPPLILSL